MPNQNDSTTMVMATRIGPTVLLSPGEAVEPAQEDGRRIRVGIVGFGRVGARRADCVVRHPEMELRAICDINPQHAGKWHRGQFHDRLPRCGPRRRPRCRLRLHLQQLGARRRRGGTRGGQRRLLRETAGAVRCGRRTDPVRRAGQLRAETEIRLQPSLPRVGHGGQTQIVDSGRYGQVLWLRGVYGKCGGIQFENEWRNDRNIAGGGILLDQGIHMLDLCRFFCGDFDQVKSLVTYHARSGGEYLLFEEPTRSPS